MAKKIIHFKDNDLNRQFDEILRNMTTENFRNKAITITSDSGNKQFLLKCDDSGNLYTEEV